MKRPGMKNMAIIYAMIIALTGILISNEGMALETSVEINDQTNKIVLSPSSQILVDESGSLSINEILSPSYQNRFVQITKDTINLGYEKSSYWIRFSLQNHSELNEDWILEFDFERAGKSVELYQTAENGAIEQITENSVKKINIKRNIPHKNTVFLINLKNNVASTIYAKISNETFLSLKLVLWNSKVFINHIKDGYLFEGVAFGIVFILAIYHLLLYRKSHRKIYPYFIVFMLVFELVSLTGKGLLYELFPSMQSLAVFIYIVSPPAMAVSLALLARIYLQSNLFSYKFDLFLKAQIWILTMVVILLLFIDSSTLMTIRSALCALITLSVIVMGPLYFKLGSQQALIFSAIMIPSLIFGILPIFVALKLIPMFFISQYGIQIGGLLLIILFSLALIPKPESYQD